MIKDNIKNTLMEKMIFVLILRELGKVKANNKTICNIHSRVDLLNEFSSRQIPKPMVIRDKTVRSDKR